MAGSETATSAAGDPFFRNSSDEGACVVESTAEEVSLVVGLESDELAPGDPFFTGTLNGNPCSIEIPTYADEESTEEDTDTQYDEPIEVGNVFRLVGNKLYILAEYNGVQGLALIKTFSNVVNSAGVSSTTGNLWVLEKEGNPRLLIEVDGDTYETVSEQYVSIPYFTYSGVVDPTTDYFYVNGSEQYFTIIDLATGSIIGTQAMEDLLLVAADWCYDINTSKAWTLNKGNLVSIDLNDGSMEYYPISLPSYAGSIFISAFSDAYGYGYFIGLDGETFKLKMKDFEDNGIGAYEEIYAFTAHEDDADAASDPTKINILS